MPADIRIVIADDHPIFRQGLRQLLSQQRGMQVIGEAGDGRAAIEAIRSGAPDVAVVDVQMPDANGVDVAQRVQQEALPTRIVFLTMHCEPALLDRALSLGVKGYVLKDAALTEIAQAVRAVADGGTFVSPAFSEYLVHRAYGDRPGSSASNANAAGDASGLASLSDRQRQIVRLIAQSRTSKEIAELLGVHYRTVENQRSAISEKLGLQGSHALVKFAFDHKSELA